MQPGVDASTYAKRSDDNRRELTKHALDENIRIEAIVTGAAVIGL